MSEKIKRYPYAEAYEIALKVLEELRPHCAKIAIAGSIRRKKADCGDVEIVTIPLPYSTGIFENGIATIVNKWPKVRGELDYGKTKYTQRILPCGIKLDLFFADEKNWGYIFAMRTGSDNFSHNTLAKRWVQCGYKGKDGYLTKDGEIVEIKEEKDLFKLIGIPFVEPEYRNL
ncbi:MAG: hypothetical protein WCS86_03615 [Candidatus Paceibacterota bacterium]